MRQEEEEEEDSLSQRTLHAGNVMNIVSDLSKDGLISLVTRHTLEADVGLREGERGRDEGEGGVTAHLPARLSSCSGCRCQ